jgi:hypothetical protein
MPTFARTWITAALTAQWAIGLILMLSALALSGWLASILVPDVDTWFLIYARAVPDLNLPGRVLVIEGHRTRHRRYLGATPGSPWLASAAPSSASLAPRWSRSAVRHADLIITRKRMRAAVSRFVCL